MTIAWPVVMRASVLRLVNRVAREVALTACRAEARTGPDHAAPAHESQRPSARKQTINDRVFEQLCLEMPCFWYVCFSKRSKSGMVWLGSGIKVYITFFFKTRTKFGLGVIWSEKEASLTWEEPGLGKQSFYHVFN